jgi:DNA-binding NarL/FixJ family response regulator
MINDPELIDDGLAKAFGPMDDLHTYRDATMICFTRVKRRFDLTDRETTIAWLEQNGFSMTMMATWMHVSLNTVRSHQRTLYKKLGVHSREEMMEVLLPIIWDTAEMSEEFQRYHPELGAKSSSL